MAQSPVIHALRDKRARLAGEIASLMKDVNRKRDALATLDAVILMFAPDCNPDMIPPIRPMGKSLVFRRGEMSRMCLSALREAGKPVKCRYVTDWALNARGIVGIDPKVRIIITERIRVALTRLESKGIVRKIMHWLDAWWELAG
jgi:hypothetical protein